jgi:hypothetical protein
MCSLLCAVLIEPNQVILTDKNLPRNFFYMYTYMFKDEAGLDSGDSNIENFTHIV